MDFSPDEGQQAVADVVTSVLERDNSWDALVAGGVTALAVPERLGGDGLGLPEIATALTEIGRHGTISPALATLGLGTAVLLDLASDAQQDRYLAGVAKGSVLTAALNEAGAPLPDRPATTFAERQAERHQGRGSLCGASGLDHRDRRQRGRGGVPEGRRRAADQDPDVEPRRRVHGDVRRRRGGRGARGRSATPGEPVGAGGDRRVRVRTRRGRAAADRRLRGQPRISSASRCRPSRRSPPSSRRSTSLRAH